MIQKADEPNRSLAKNRITESQSQIKKNTPMKNQNEMSNAASISRSKTHFPCTNTMGNLAKKSNHNFKHQEASASDRKAMTTTDRAGGKTTIPRYALHRHVKQPQTA